MWKMLYVVSSYFGWYICVFFGYDNLLDFVFVFVYIIVIKFGNIGFNILKKKLRN